MKTIKYEIEILDLSRKILHKEIIDSFKDWYFNSKDDEDIFKEYICNERYGKILNFESIILNNTLLYVFSVIDIVEHKDFGVEIKLKHIELKPNKEIFKLIGDDND